MQPQVLRVSPQILRMSSQVPQLMGIKVVASRTIKSASVVTRTACVQVEAASGTNGSASVKTVASLTL